MENQDVVLLVAQLILGGLIPFVSEYVNKVGDLHKEKALVVVGIVCAAVAVGALLLTGSLTPADLTLANFSKSFLVVFGVSQLVFNYAKIRLWPQETPAVK